MFRRNIISKYRSNLLIQSYSIIHQKPLISKIVNNNNKNNNNNVYKSKLYLSSAINNKVNYFDVDSLKGVYQYGDYNLIASQNQVYRKFTDVKTLGSDIGSIVGDNIWIRGRISSIRIKGNACFLVIRSGTFNTVQACHFKDKDNLEESKNLLKYLNSLSLESIVDIQGQIVSADVKSCSQSNVELQIKKIFTVSKTPAQLPFSIEDASRSQEDIDNSQGTERPVNGVTQEMRLNNRWLDLRVPSNNAIFRVKSGISLLFRQYLMKENFIEINTPKLIAGSSEGGSEVFYTDYFGKKACLAQSPQLYKQMAISSDFNRVFEIGPVFRAENSNTRRHLCEFIGLDIEMAINEHYNETLSEILYKEELVVIRKQYPSSPVQFTEEPLIIHWEDGMKMLTDAGHDIDVMADMNTAIELTLGELVKSKYNSDFYILDQYPLAIRPFYTMPHPDNPLLSNSYDMFIRGQEICSGAQRCHDVEMLENRIRSKDIDIDPLRFYIDSFKHGISPHAGAGIGLERVVFLYLGLDNVRKTSMFPRDPSRITP